MKKIFTCGMTAFVLVFAACSDMPTSTSIDEEPTFVSNGPGGLQVLSKIGQGSFTNGSTLGLAAPSLTINTPSASSGDLLIAQVTVADLKTTEAICLPSGWTSILRTNSGDNLVQEIFWRPASGAPSSTTWFFRTTSADCVTSTNPKSNKAIGGIIAYSNVDIAHAGGPVFASLGASSSTDLTSFDAPSIANAPAGTRVIRFFGVDKKENLISTSGSGSATIYSVRNVKADDSIELPSIAAADAEQSVLGPTGTATGTVTDHGGKWDAQTVVLYAANTKPTLSKVPSDTTVCEEVELTFTAKATDDDVPAQTLTFSLEGTVPTGASINSVTGVFKWTPAENQDGGPYSFQVRVTDDGVPPLYDEKTINITVSEANVAPVLDPIGNMGATAGNLFGFTATASDADLVAGSPNTLTFSLQGVVPGDAAINPSTGYFSWTPTVADVGDNFFTVRVTDNGPDGPCGTGAQYDEETFKITVAEEYVTPDAEITVELVCGSEDNGVMKGPDEAGKVSIKCFDPKGEWKTDGKGKYECKGILAYTPVLTGPDSCTP